MACMSVRFTAPSSATRMSGLLAPPGCSSGFIRGAGACVAASADTLILGVYVYAGPGRRISMRWRWSCIVKRIVRDAGTPARLEMRWIWAERGWWSGVVLGYGLQLGRGEVERSVGDAAGEVDGLGVEVDEVGVAWEVHPGHPDARRGPDDAAGHAVLAVGVPGGPGLFLAWRGAEQWALGAEPDADALPDLRRPRLPPDRGADAGVLLVV